MLPTRLLIISTVTLLVLSFSVIGGSCAASFQISGHAHTSWPGGLIINHNCVNISLIPLEWVEEAKRSVVVHYAHTSHGGQITTGLELIESEHEDFNVAIEYSSLPTEADALCIYDGNGDETYITPDLYWATPEGLARTQATLDNNPTITVSLWSWCTQLNYYSEEETQSYLDAMSALETANPDVTFVYMTCNAQSGDYEGYNRHLRNEMIREYCIANGKILFDFADLDCWYNGEYSTYEYDDGGTVYEVPIEHPHYNGDEAGHTTYESCEQKGRAFWWMVAMLAGWNAPNVTDTNTHTTHPSIIDIPVWEVALGVGLIAVLLILAIERPRRG